MPFIAYNTPGHKFDRAECGVSDVAPTLLTYMGIEIPPEMTGKSLF